MFFDSIDEIAEIAGKTGTSIFVVPRDVKVGLKGAMVLQPEAKATITIEQVREVMARLGLRQTDERFVLIRPAELLGLEAANALLKNLEEPGDKIHYVLVTDTPSRILPTILSRAAIYCWRETTKFDLGIEADETDKAMAKQLIAAKPDDLVEIAEKLAKKKTARTDALRVVGLAVEMLYKSYFITGKAMFVKKLPRFLAAYENISRNGHVKLHLVADLC